MPYDKTLQERQQSHFQVAFYVIFLRLLLMFGLKRTYRKAIDIAACYRYCKLDNGLELLIPEAADYFPSYWYFRTQSNYAQNLYDIHRRGLIHVTNIFFRPNIQFDPFIGWDKLFDDFLTLGDRKISANPTTFDWIANEKTVQLLDSSFPKWRRLTNQDVTIMLNPYWWISQDMLSRFLASLPVMKSSWMITTSTPFNEALKVDQRGYFNQSLIDSEASTGITLYNLSNLKRFQWEINNIALASWIEGLKWWNTSDTQLVRDTLAWDVGSDDHLRTTMISVLPIVINNGDHYKVAFGNGSLLGKSMIANRIPGYELKNVYLSEYGDVNEPEKEAPLWPSLVLIYRHYGVDSAVQILRHWVLAEYLGSYVSLQLLSMLTFYSVQIKRS